ncbi:hypothetical protein D3C72_1593060 [compost metagenome]
MCTVVDLEKHDLLAGMLNCWRHVQQLRQLFGHGMTVILIAPAINVDTIKSKSTDDLKLVRQRLFGQGAIEQIPWAAFHTSEAPVQCRGMQHAGHHLIVEQPVHDWNFRESDVGQLVDGRAYG